MDQALIGLGILALIAVCVYAAVMTTLFFQRRKDLHVAETSLTSTRETLAGVEKGRDELRQQNDDLRREHSRQELEREKLLRQVEELSRAVLVDVRTGHYNDDGFKLNLRNAVGLALRNGLPLVVIFLDGNGFKRVNDIYGHAAGDDVIIALGHALRAAFQRGGDFIGRKDDAVPHGDEADRKGKDFIGRKGGDEFVLAMPATTIGGAMRALYRFAREVSAIRVHTDKGVVTISVSVGVSILEIRESDVLVDGQDMGRLIEHRGSAFVTEISTLLLKASDGRMYKAKEAAHASPSGGNFAFAGGEVIDLDNPPDDTEAALVTSGPASIH